MSDKEHELEQEIQESIAGHGLRSAELLETLRERGAGLDKARPVQHHLWAASQRDAAHLARELYRAGYLLVELSPRESEDGSRFWKVEAEKECSPLVAASAAVTEEMVRLAARFDSLYDGWGIEI